MKKIFFANLLFASSLFSTLIEEKPMVVVVPSYNNYKWCASNVQSILSQDYKNFRIIYIDDKSSDETVDKVEKLIARHRISSFHKITFDDQKSKDILKVTNLFQKKTNENQVFFTLVVNKNRAGALANLYRSIWSCSNEEIIVTLDGDDWFSDRNVLKRLNEIYTSGDVWLTHGTMIEYPSGSQGWSEPIPPYIIENNAFRSFKCPSHLRTFYAGLFKKINLEDLVYQGDFFSMTWDMAIMYPMIEMCAERHAFVSVPNYIYNTSNPINDNKVNAELQRTLDRLIREKPPYQRLENFIIH